MKRTINVEVSLSGIDVDCSPLFCQGDRNTHFISIHFLEDVELTGYTLEAYYLPPYPSTTPYVDSFSNPTMDMVIPIPNKLLERNGVVTVELALSKGKNMITINEPFCFQVEKTINSTFVNAYPEGNLKETIDEKIAKIKELLAKTDEKIKEYNDNAEQKTLAFNENSAQKTVNFDNNASDKTDAYNLNATNKKNEYDNNAKTKLDAYNANDKQKTDAYNENDRVKTETYNANDLAKTTAFNSNATNKTKEFDTHVTETLKTAYADLDAKAIESANKASQEAIKLVKAQETKSIEAVSGEGTKQVGLVTSEGDKQILRVQNTGTEEVKKVTDAGTKAVSDVGATKDAVVKAVTDEGNKQKQNLITQQGLSIKAVTDEGTKQVELVTAEGNKQKKIVSDEGVKQVQLVNTKIGEIKTEATKQKEIVIAEGNRVIDEVKKIISGTPTQGDAVTLGGKTRAEFEREIHGVAGKYNGDFPLISAVLDGVYLHKETGRLYVCIEAYNGDSIAKPNGHFEELSVLENRRKIKELNKDYIKQLSHNFRGLTSTLDINSSSPELEFLFNNVNKDKLEIDKMKIISSHTFGQPSPALSQDTLKVK